MLVSQDRQRSCGAAEVGSSGRQRALAETWNAEDRDHARRAAAAFKLAYGAKFGKAVAKITDDLDELTDAVTVSTVLGLCLFRSEGYDAVLAQVLPLPPGVLAPGELVPTGSALSQARTRLHGDALGTLFAATAGAGEQASVPGACWLGLELTVFDGTVLDLAATAEIAAEFAIPSGGRFPQARLVTLASCGTRRVRAAAVDSSAVSEQALATGSPTRWGRAR